MDIELGEDGPTPNDVGDSDAGPNELQNFPVISRVTRDAGVTSVAGGLNSAPSSMFTLQFFATGATRTAAPTLLGTRSVDTNTAGDARFEFAFPFVTSADQFITATATDAKGNTSEFLPADAEAELANMSTRGFVGADDEILIGGIMRREASSPRPLLVRALGPSLNIGDQLADPRLTVYGPDGTSVAENDDWKSSPEQEQKIRGTGLAPADDREAAILVAADSTAGQSRHLTLQVSGSGSSTGIATVEVYALGGRRGGSSDELLNMSTRGKVGANDKVLIGGVIVQGSATQRVLVRAIGPELARAGIREPLQDPTLELRDSDGNLLMANDNWRTDQEQEIIATGLAPKEDRECAMIATLLPMLHTAIVRGKNDSSGIALVEFYALD